VRLIYLTVATIPNKTAHSKYVMKLCESFKNNGKDVSIVSGKIKNINEKIEFKSYRLRIKEGKYKSLILAIFHFFYLLKQKLFFESKQEIYIVHNSLSAIFCSLLNVNYIIDMHAKILKNKKSKKIISKNSPLFWIVQSNLLYEFVNNELNVKKDQILLSRNAVSEITSYEKIDEFYNNDKIIKFCYIGRLVPNTGFDDIIKAINNIKYNNFIIYVAGDYERYKSFYQDLFKKYPNSKNKIVFLGYLNENEINYLSNESDILMALYSSKISILGALSPMKIFEYLRFNKKILVPKIDDINEIVEYYNCEDRMRWYEIDNIVSLRKSILNLIEEKKYDTLEKINVETWDEKAKNILNFINNNYKKII
jgi:glycosyltransferase involved in cell wall biosynthesis